MKLKLTLIFFLLFLKNIQSQTIIVSNDSPGTFPTIQEAIDAASPGSVITVEKGIYRGPIIMKERVSLVGIDYPVIDGHNSGFVVAMASNCCISGFKIIHSGSETGLNDCGILARNVTDAIILGNEICNNGHYGVILDNARCKMHYNSIHKNDILGVYINGIADFDIGFNAIQFHEHSAIYIGSDQAKGNIYNNLIAFNHYGIDAGISGPEFPESGIYNNIIYSNNKGISAPKDFHTNLTYNCFYNNYSDCYDWESGTTIEPEKSNILKDPRLNISEVSYMHINGNSPCINNGINGTDIGNYRFDNGKERNFAKKKWGKIASPYWMKFRGTATNLTADTLQSDFSGVLYSEDGFHYRFRGQYDNIHLFGTVEMSGVIISQESDPFMEIEFKEGKVTLGNDNSGYPRGFTLPHTGLVRVCDGMVIGTYRCGPSSPYLEMEQNGSYELKVLKASKSMQPGLILSGLGEIYD